MKKEYNFNPDLLFNHFKIPGLDSEDIRNWRGKAFEEEETPQDNGLNGLTIY